MQTVFWFLLRKTGVYDNTRIILVADHGGYYLEHLPELSYNIDGYEFSAEIYYPLLMVKDFGKGEFKTSDEFMTNADVPTLAVEGIIDDPLNPFTGNPINNDEKFAHDQFIMTSRDWETEKNDGNDFTASSWLSVKDSIWSAENWSCYSELVVLDEHAFPAQ